MRFGSVCSGIEAASVAWEPIGWKAAWFAEIEPFPCAVLKHHYPDTPNLGDMNLWKEWPDAAIDVLCGGTPCQSFSVAGLRKGLDDPRGNLMLTFLAIAKRHRPRWLVWENVPGVLSSNGGRDFGSFLGGLAECGYGFAYRVLDAQYFGLAQRRKRVFVVAYLGNWRPAAAVLFERESLCGHPAPRREAGQGPANGASESFGIRSAHTSSNGWGIQRELTHTLDTASPQIVACGTASGRQDFETEAFITTTAHAFDARQSNVIQYGDNTGPLDTDGHSVGVLAPTLTASNDPSRSPQSSEVTQQVAAVLQASMQVRRLTPVECERLQGFPDGYTAIPWRGKQADQCPDGPRYKALGNSWAVPVVRWIGERINLVDSVLEQQEVAA